MQLFSEVHQNLNNLRHFRHRAAHFVECFVPVAALDHTDERSLALLGMVWSGGKHGKFEKVASAMKSSMILDFADNVHAAQFLKRDN